jgi:hypothetical protein
MEDSIVREFDKHSLLYRQAVERKHLQPVSSVTEDFQRTNSLSSGEMLAVKLEAQRMWRIRDLTMEIQEMERRGEYTDPAQAHLKFLRRDGFGEQAKYLAMYATAYEQKMFGVRWKHHDD